MVIRRVRESRRPERGEEKRRVGEGEEKRGVIGEKKREE